MILYPPPTNDPGQDCCQGPRRRLSLRWTDLVWHLTCLQDADDLYPSQLPPQPIHGHGRTTGSKVGARHLGTVRYGTCGFRVVSHPGVWGPPCQVLFQLFSPRMVRPRVTPCEPPQGSERVVCSTHTEVFLCRGAHCLAVDKSSENSGAFLVCVTCIWAKSVFCTLEALSSAFMARDIFLQSNSAPWLVLGWVGGVTRWMNHDSTLAFQESLLNLSTRSLLKHANKYHQDEKSPKKRTSMA